MSKGKTEPVSVRITPNTSGNPAGKLADAEVIFEADAGPLTGLKLIGFAIWERRTGGRNVTFPARQYSVNGERRSFALLRPAEWGRQRTGGHSDLHPRRVQPPRGADRVNPERTGRRPQAFGSNAELPSPRRSPGVEGGSPRFTKSFRPPPERIA